MTQDVERILRAVAKAHRQTGVPITVHASRLEVGAGGAPGAQDGGCRPDPGRARPRGDSTDADHLSGLADLGYLLGMDAGARCLVAATRARAAARRRRPSLVGRVEEVGAIVARKS